MELIYMPLFIKETTTSGPYAALLNAPLQFNQMSYIYLLDNFQYAKESYITSITLKPVLNCNVTTSTIINVLDTKINISVKNKPNDTGK